MGAASGTPTIILGTTTVGGFDMIYWQNKISSDDVEDNPEVIFVYLENFDCKAGDSLARSIREFDNAHGIRVKRSPGSSASAYYTGEDVPEACTLIEEDIEAIRDYIKSDVLVVMPAMSFFIDQTSLEERSPEVYEYMIDALYDLQRSGNWS